MAIVPYMYSLFVLHESQLYVQNVEPTGKRILVAVDISHSMHYGNVTGIRHLTPVQVAAAMTMLTVRLEKQCDVISFARDVTVLDLESSKKLTDVMKRFKEVSSSGTSFYGRVMLTAVLRPSML